MARLWQRFRGDFDSKVCGLVEEDLRKGLNEMENLMRLEKPGHNLPVAFASNTLYVLARNGLA